MLPFFVKFLKWKYFFLMSLAIPCALRSGIHWPINFSKKNWRFCIFSKRFKKNAKLKRREGSFQLFKLSKLRYHFCQVLRMEIIFLISLAIPRPSRSKIHWPINFSQKIDVSVYTKKMWQVYIGISILVIPDHMVCVQVVCDFWWWTPTSVLGNLSLWKTSL